MRVKNQKDFKQIKSAGSLPIIGKSNMNNLNWKFSEFTKQETDQVKLISKIQKAASGETVCYSRNH